MGNGIMKKKCRMRHFFNMIEVSLALGVTAVGVLGAITILPVALKTTNSATYSAYLSDAANMVFMGIDDYLNTECFSLDYEKEHKVGVSAKELADIYQKRREKFGDIFYPGESNEKAAEKLNSGLKITTPPDSKGVHILHVKDKNNGLIAFYSETPEVSSLSLPDYIEGVSADIGRPLFSARYRIVVTDLENDNEFKMDGFRQLVEVQTEQTTKEWTDPRTGKTQKITVPGARVAGTKRYKLSEEEEKLMKRVYIEFSWPINAAYHARNKKTFVREYYITD